MQPFELLLDKSIYSNTLFEHLDLLVNKDIRREMNVRDNTNDLNISQVLINAPCIWRGCDVVRCQEKKKIIISDAEYLSFTDRWINHCQRQLDNIDPVMRSTFVFDKDGIKKTPDFYFWDALIEQGFEIYLWDKSRECLQKPIRTFRDFLNRFTQDTPRYVVADAPSVEMQLTQWGEVPGEFKIIDNSQKRLLLNKLADHLTTELSSGNIQIKTSTGDEPHMDLDATLNDIESFKMYNTNSKYSVDSYLYTSFGTRILNELIKEQHPDDEFDFTNFSSEHDIDQVMNDISNLNEIQNFVCLPYSLFEKMSLSAHLKKLDMEAFTFNKNECLDLSHYTELEVITVKNIRIKQIMLPKNGKLKSLSIINPIGSSLSLENVQQQTQLESLTLDHCSNVTFDQSYSLTCPPTLTTLSLRNFGSETKRHTFNLSACRSIRTFELLGGGIHEVLLPDRLHDLNIFRLQTSSLNALSGRGTLYFLDESEFIWDSPGIKLSTQLQSCNDFQDNCLTPFMVCSKNVLIHSSAYFPSMRLSPLVGVLCEKVTYDLVSSNAYITNLNWEFRAGYKHIEIRAVEFRGKNCDLSQSVGLEQITLYSELDLNFSHINLPVNIQRLHIKTPARLKQCNFSELTSLKALTLHAQSIQGGMTLHIPEQIETLDIYVQDCENLVIDVTACQHLKTLKLPTGVQLIPSAEELAANSRMPKIEYYPTPDISPVSMQDEPVLLPYTIKRENWRLPNNVPFDQRTGSNQNNLRAERKFSQAGRPVGNIHLARYDILNAVNEQGAYYVPGTPVPYSIPGLNDQTFSAQQQDPDYVYAHDNLTLTTSKWSYLPNLQMRTPLSTRAEVVDLCDMAYFPDRDQYGIKLKSGSPRTLDVEYAYHTDGEHAHPSLPTIPTISSEVRDAMSNYISKLPLNESDGLTKILLYCATFSTENELKPEGPEYLRPMLSQAGVCRHRATACLMLCAYKHLPCRLVTNDTHAYVETFDEKTKCWKAHDLGGGVANIDYYDPRPVNRIKPDETLPAVVKVTKPAPAVALKAKNNETPALFTSLFKHETTLNQRLKPEDFIRFISDTHGILLRFQHSQFAWNLNRALMQHYLSQPSAVPGQYLYVHDPKQMKRLFSQFQIDDNGHAQELPGPLKELIRQKGLLLINWSDFSATETAIYKSMFDQIPTLHDQSVDKALTIIGLEQQDRIKDDDSFYSRMRVILNLPSALETDISRPVNAPSSTVVLDNVPSVYLYHDTQHWHDVLCGKPGVNRNKFNFKAGGLLDALKNHKPGIVLYDPPLMLPEFNDFLHTLRIKKQVLINGRYYPVPDDFQIRIETTPALSLSDVTVALEPTSGALDINSSTYASLFSNDSIDSEGFVHSHPTGLFAEYDHFVLTTALEPALEQRLLHQIKQANKCLSIRTKVTPKPLRHAHDSGLIFSNDPYFVVNTIKPSLPNCITHYVDLHTTWNELIETLTINSYKPLNIKRTPSVFLEALMSGQTVVFYGQMNLELYQRISSLFNQQHYLLVNGEKLKPTGNILFITEEQSDPLYAQAIHQEKKTISLSDYQSYFDNNYAPEDVDRLLLIYQLAEKSRISLPCNVYYLGTCLKQLAKTTSILAKEKVIKSVLLANFSHHSEEYACINVLAKVLFSTEAKRPLSVKRHAKLKLSLENIRTEPWRAANCLSGAELRQCFDLNHPTKDIHTLFAANGSLQLCDAMQDKLYTAAEKILTSMAQTDIIQAKQNERFDRFLHDDKSHVLILQGDPGIGKTHLVTLFNGNKFWGKDQVLRWLQSPDAGPKILTLDEYNLEDNAFWSFFEDLHKGYVCYQGTNYPVSKDHKIVCTCNPSYYPERKKQTTLPSQAITLYFKHPDDGVLRNIIANELRDIETHQLDAIQNIFLVSYHLVKKDWPENVSLRDLHMLCQRFRYLKKQVGNKRDVMSALEACIKEFIGLYPLGDEQQRFKRVLFEKLNTQPLVEPRATLQVLDSGYALPPSRSVSWNLILEDIALLRTGDLKAKGGILIEGSSGIGKTRMYTEALEYLQLPYDLISSGSKDVEKTLQKAFKEGRAVVLDELNLDPALEKLLGKYLTGVDELGAKMPVPGFFVLASQNPTCYAGRKKLSASFLNRFHRCTLSDYPDAERIAIAEQSLHDPVLAKAFVSGFIQVKHDGIHQINSRNFFTELEKFSALPDEKMNDYRQALEIPHVTSTSSITKPDPDEVERRKQLLEKFELALQKFDDQITQLRNRKFVKGFKYFDNENEIKSLAHTISIAKQMHSNLTRYRDAYLSDTTITDQEFIENSKEALNADGAKENFGQHRIKSRFKHILNELLRCLDAIVCIISTQGFRIKTTTLKTVDAIDDTLEDISKNKPI